ncbi:MAG TPA: amidohydrolase family protein [Puia sp.]|jgi:cytosine/adenosine deaminase-related metal-dependent hydrolase|nr:amidohydrolase family protein [Puia sp.]
MRLNNLRFPDADGLHDLWIHDGKITAILPSHPSSSTMLATVPSISFKTINSNWGEFATIRPNVSDTHPATPEPSIDLNGALAFPGLINSHDHLDFNLFPALANRIYNSYTEWGPDIQASDRTAIQRIRKIPQPLRTQWGIYKNLLNGFTTVVNHGKHLDIKDPPVTVFQDCYCLHSVGFEPNWKWKLNRPAKTGRPFAIHAGEGTDVSAAKEIDELIRWNLFHRPLIGIHGVAMTAEQAAAFHALVWCPASNYFLLDRTAAIDQLHAKVRILFGTDSTLTAGWNAWEQMRMARNLRLITDDELFATLTINPATAWGLAGRGTLAPGKMADLVIARPLPGMTGMDAFFTLDPRDILLVVHAGRIRLFDRSLLGPITENSLTAESFQPARPGGKYVAGDLPGLMQEIRSYCPDIAFPLF